MIVIEGEGLMVINGEEHIVHPNDAVFISPGTHHGITGHGGRDIQNKLDLRLDRLVDDTLGINASLGPASGSWRTGTDG